MASSSKYCRKSNCHTKCTFDGVSDAIAVVSCFPFSCSLAIGKEDVIVLVGLAEIEGGVVGLNACLRPKVIDERIDLDAKSNDEEGEPNSTPC